MIRTLHSVALAAAIAAAMPAATAFATSPAGNQAATSEGLGNFEIQRQLRDMEIILGAAVVEMQALEAQDRLGNFEIQRIVSQLRRGMQPLLAAVTAEPQALRALCNNEVIEGVFKVLDDRLGQQAVGQMTPAERGALVQSLVTLHQGLDQAVDAAQSC